MSPARQAQIDLHALAVALAEHGAESATGATLARAAGVAKPTLYARFGSREALVEACVEHEAEQLVERVVGIDDAGEAVAAYVADAPGWPLLLLSRHPAAIAARARVAARIASRGTTPAAASAFLAAAAATLELRSADAPTPVALARALLR